MLPVPSVADVAAFTGQPEQTYGPYIKSALLQAALMLTINAELDTSDYAGLDANDQQMVNFGIIAMADYIYLRQPYRQILASPLMNETVGSYSYAKAQQEIARNAAVLEVTAERTGVLWYDMAFQFLSKRTRAGGVFSGGITVFEDGNRIDQAQLMIRQFDNRMVIVGPAEVNRGNLPFDINAPVFPQDPGV